MRITKFKPWAGGVLFASFMLAGCSSSGTDSTDSNIDTQSNSESSLEWSACDTEDADNMGGLECATLSVPMSYDDPNGVNIDLALIRRVATSDNPLGSLLTNPGGPGGSGVELIREAFDGTVQPQSVLENYHIVGFDPRGIGGSTPVNCSEFGVEEINNYPLDEAAVAQIHQDFTDFAGNCFAKHGEYLQHLGSLNVVRDMEEIRKALGEPEINFIGYSYGTRLAALYLQEFPSTSGRFVLDGSVHPESEIEPLVADVLPVMQSALTALLSRCDFVDTDCDVNTLNARLNDRVRTLAADPARIDELELLGNLVISAIENPDFGEFAAIPLINYVNTLDVAVLEAFVQMILSLSDDADEAETEDNEDELSDGSLTAQIAVLCADDANRYDVGFLNSKLQEFNLVSDIFAELQISELAQCSGWVEALEPLAPIVTNTAPVSIVIGGTTDAQTILPWSEDMAEAIGGVFIRSEHSGHTAVFNDESDCIDALVEDFLLSGALPDNRVCGVE